MLGTSQGHNMFDEFKLEKWVWDDDDFERMGWHDATIHGIAFGPTEFELSLDIDYIFEWVHPAADQEFFRFWVAPCTLVFQNVYEVRVEAESYGEPVLSVDDLHRGDPRPPRNAEYIGKDQEWRWTFECHHGELTFRAVGFKQYIRRAPILSQSQVLGLPERGGYSFDNVKSA